MVIQPTSGILSSFDWFKIGNSSLLPPLWTYCILVCGKEKVQMRCGGNWLLGEFFM